MAIFDVIKSTGGEGLLAWRFPGESFSTGSRLIVSESQEAVILKGGQLIGPFGPGTHVLDTNNLPILKTIVALPFGGQTPFTFEVWFVNRATVLDVKWGTAEPIQMLDPQFNVLLPIRANGQFGIRVRDSRAFLTQLVGTLSDFSLDRTRSYFRGVMMTCTKDTIAEIVSRQRVSVLQIATQLEEISSSLRQRLQERFERFGLDLTDFSVMGISTPEDDSAVQSLKQALSKRAEMNIVGYDYRQERSFNTLETAAGNTSAGAAPLLGAGMGLGMGLGMGGPMGAAMGGMASQISTAGAASVCGACRTPAQTGDRFCRHCGARIPNAGPIPCKKCQSPLGENARFCSNCGTAAPEGHV
jgi:hypothetical protein